jgi:arginine repressor
LSIELRAALFAPFLRLFPVSPHSLAPISHGVPLPEVASLIAGDDTLFVAFPDRGSLQRIKRRLVRLSEGVSGG